MLFLPSKVKTFSLLETCFSPVVQRSAVHLYNPTPCTRFIGNSWFFFFFFNCIALFQWEFGCWHDTFGFQWENVCLGLCAMCTLDFLHTILCDSHGNSSSHRWKCHSTQLWGYLGINICQSPSCFLDAKCSSWRVERESWSLIKIWSLSTVTTKPR